MHELIIIGAGPAGLTAAVYAARKRIDFLIISKDIGGEALLSSDVENYLGYHHISGKHLVERFEEHLKDYNIQLMKGEAVKEIAKKGGGFLVTTDNAGYEAKAVIIAAGKKPRMLNVPGEKEFKNRGVTYCATCDAPLFAKKDVAVIGGGNAAFDAALQLMKIAKKVHVIIRGKKPIADPIMLEKVLKNKKVVLVNEAVVSEITGDALVKEIKIVEKGKKERKLAVQGVFIEIGSIPCTDFDMLTKKNKLNEIIVDKKCNTSIPGIFAAGDITDVPEKQIIIAAGHGAIAAIEAVYYLSRKR